MTVWTLFQAGLINAPAKVPGLWHAHGMIFSYTVAIITGFLLTAVPRWSNAPAISTSKLKLLFSAWLGASILSFFAELNLLSHIFQGIFWLVLLSYIFPTLVRGKTRNYGILLILTIIFVWDFVFRYGYSTNNFMICKASAHGALGTIMILIVVIANRIIPLFTRNALGLKDLAIKPFIPYAAIIGAISYNFLVVIRPRTSLVMILIAVCAFAVLTPVFYWWRRAILKQPILLIMYSAYLWVVIGITLSSVTVALSLPPLSSIHAMTIGGVGVMTYAMISRVALGHTGREIKAHSLTVLGYILLNLSAIWRVFAPMLNHDYITGIEGSGVLWIASFLLLAVAYTKILINPKLS